MCEWVIFSGHALGDNKAGEAEEERSGEGVEKKLFCISRQKVEDTQGMWCVFCAVHRPGRRIECYVIMENDLLGTNKKPRNVDEEGVKEGEEAWKRIIAKYNSSIRDAFLGLRGLELKSGNLWMPRRALRLKH